MNQFLLVGDVGSARMVLGLASTDGATLTDIQEISLADRGGTAVEEIVTAFLREMGVRVAAACFSVAGPVVDEQVWFPSSKRHVDQRRLREALAIPRLTLVNDLQATARALPHLAPNQFATLQMGVADASGSRAVISAEAGLGQAMLIAQGQQRVALASEGGHADFAPNGALQEELLAFLRAELGHVSYERVCSSGGIHNIYRFLRGRAGEPEPSWLAQSIAAAADPAAAIIAAAGAAERPCAVCRQALEVFAAILGAECGNMALRTLPTAGLFVGGVLPRQMLPVLRGGAFLAAFRHKGPMSDLIRRIPVHVILEQHAALFGAAQYARALVA
jgi:glucokinase